VTLTITKAKKKVGTPGQRQSIAAHARKHHGLKWHGSWTRKTWNYQIRLFIATALKRLSK
jgi:hypothetical protein